jgi:ParB/RepB/Spo0J family partition protein
MAEYKVIPVKEIMPDPNQPRKFFDESSMLELTASIKTNGVLQPIMVRPHANKYMLVCGERRLKATIAAGIKEIPAVIRHLADDEALEVQITENLQRKDVHPMEEAVAFKKLADKYTPDEIALRVGKSESFIVKRIKLADLVNDAQELFFSNRIEMKHAAMLSRLDPELQNEILKEVLPNDWKNPESDIRRWQIERCCDDASERLDKAPFKTSDAKLYPEAGACTKCKFNSSNQPLLFDDLKGKHCTKPACFNIKVARHETKELHAIAADPGRFVIAGSNYPDSKEKATVAAAKELGVNVLDEKMYSKIYEDTEPGTWEEYAEDYDFEDDPEGEEQAKIDYADHVRDCAENKARLDEARKEGRVVDAYVLLGNDKGKTIPIELKPAAKIFVDAASGNAGDNEIISEIAGIEMREMRNKELDHKKIYQAAREKFLKDAPEDHEGSDFISMKHWRDGIEYGNILRDTDISRVVCGFLYEALDYSAKSDFKENIIKPYLKVDWVSSESEIEYFLTVKVPGSVATKLIQYLVVGKAFPMNGHESSSVAHAMSMDFARLEFADALKTIELEQEEKAIKRQENVAKKIKALRNKMTAEPVV